MPFQIYKSGQSRVEAPTITHTYFWQYNTIREAGSWKQGTGAIGSASQSIMSKKVIPSAESAKQNPCAALTGLLLFLIPAPGLTPWALLFRAFSACPDAMSFRVPKELDPGNAGVSPAFMPPGRRLSQEFPCCWEIRTIRTKFSFRIITTMNHILTLNTFL